MSKTEITNTLKIILANSYILYLKTQNYHWNVTGSNFYSLHLLFESQYKDLSDAIDLIAERIRAIGSKAPANITYYQNNSSIKDGNENYSATEMLEDLMKDQKIITKLLYKSMDIAKKHNDETTISMLADRIEIHDKNHWMINSLLSK